MPALYVQNTKNISQGKKILVREKSGKGQGNVLYSNCGHSAFMSGILGSTTTDGLMPNQFLSSDGPGN